MGIELLKNQLDWCHMEFHEHLKKLRESKELTQMQVAETVGIAKNTYIGYEKGTREPRLSELKKLSELFQMTLSELCMEADSSSIDEKLVLQFKVASRFKGEVLNTFNTMLEALYMLQSNREITAFQFGKDIAERTLFNNPLTEDELDDL